MTSKANGPLSGRPGCLGGLLKALAGTTEPRPRLPGVEAFSLRPSLNTPGGQAFFHALEQAVPQGHVVVPEVGMASLFDVKAREGRQSAFNRIAQKRIDYVVCERHFMRPVCAIELDDKSHQRADRQARDVFVDEMFRATRLPLLRIRARSSYQVDEIREQLAAALKK